MLTRALALALVSPLGVSTSGFAGDSPDNAGRELIWAISRVVQDATGRK